MTAIKDGGPAFPPSLPGYNHGMSIRDFFAANAMQGMLSAGSISPYKAISVWAYQVADEMLAAREKGGS